MRVNLRAERLNRGLSSQEAADEMGIEKHVLLGAESGLSTPRPANAKAIADFYGYKVTDIWPLEEEVRA